MPSNNALESIPVEKVGGPRDRGPWPTDVEEIARGNTYDREVPVKKLTEHGDLEVVGREMRPVTVTQIQQLTRPDGTDTGGRVVAFQYDHTEANR